MKINLIYMGKKLNLKKKLAPYTLDDEYLKAQSKLLKSIVYPENDDCELGNSARVLNPDEDAMDLVKGKFLDEFQQGGH